MVFHFVNALLMSLLRMVGRAPTVVDYSEYSILFSTYNYQYSVLLGVSKSVN
jgi:hypothetical protein